MIFQFASSKASSKGSWEPQEGLLLAFWGGPLGTRGSVFGLKDVGNRSDKEEDVQRSYRVQQPHVFSVAMCLQVVLYEANIFFRPKQTKAWVLVPRP